MGDGIFSNVVTNGVVIKRIEEQHLVVALQRHGQVIDVVLRGGSILRREEVHGTKAAVGIILAEAVQAPLPFGIEFLFLTNHIEIKLGNIVVSIDMDAEVHPLVVNARQVAGAIATSVHGAVARSSGRILTIIGQVHVNLHGPRGTSTAIYHKVVQHVEVTVLAFRNIGIEFEVVNTDGNLAELNDLVVPIGEMSGHRATSFTKDTIS